MLVWDERILILTDVHGYGVSPFYMGFAILNLGERSHIRDFFLFSMASYWVAINAVSN